MAVKKLGIVGVVGALLAAAGSASAHHSFAMFDKDKEVTLKGEVKEFQWTNPHAWVQVMAPAPGKTSGAPVEWSIEMGSVNILARQGWKKSTFKPGDKVTVIINPMRDGSAGGSLVRATTADGKPIPANWKSGQSANPGQ